VDGGRRQWTDKSGAFANEQVMMSNSRPISPAVIDRPMHQPTPTDATAAPWARAREQCAGPRPDGHPAIVCGRRPGGKVGRFCSSSYLTRASLLESPRKKYRRQFSGLIGPKG
jgi:hypothetical protein